MTYGQRGKWVRLRANQCKEPGCSYPIFSHGYCSKHSYRWKSKEPIPRYKKRKPTRAEAFGFTTLPELFMYVVYEAARPIICPVSGEDITPLFSQDFDIWKCCCAHVLSRKMYPLWKLNPHNIILLAPTVHNLYDQGTELQRQKHADSNWQYLYDLKDKLKIEYNEQRNAGTFKEGANDDIKNQADNQASEEDGQERGGDNR
jgi:hypothetical protein